MFPRDYIESWFIDDRVILGQRLRPLSLGHLLLLGRVKSKYVEGGVPMLDDLLLGLIICSNDFKTGCALIESPDELFRGVYKWGRRLNFHPWYKLWRRKAPPNLELASNDFQQYLKDGQKRPRLMFPDDPNDGPKSGAPWVERLLTNLRGLGVPESVAMDMPLRRLWHIHFTALDEIPNCGVRYMTPAEIEMHEEAKK